MVNLSVGFCCDLAITDLGHEGQGIGRWGDAVVFVPGALPGERVRVRLLHRARRHWLAELQSLIVASDQRRRPPCVLADRCGGCSLQHLSPSAQGQWKTKSVHQALARIGKLDHPVLPLLEAASGLGYRNRAVIPLERRPDGSLRGGYYGRGSHRIVNMNHCPVLDPRLDALIKPLKADLEASPWPVDRHSQAGGGLRHMALRLGANSGELLLTLISSHGRLPGLAELANQWLERWPQLVGVCLNLQPLPTNLLMGPTTELIAGRNWLHENFAGFELQIASDTFFQVFTAQAERVVPLLLQAMAGLASSQPPATVTATVPVTVIDAYCGIGTYSLPMAASGFRVLGLELNPQAVKLAEANAARNGQAKRCQFLAGDVAQQLAAQLPMASALFVDPPRRGLEAQVVGAICACPPQRLAYLSCDPASLARDLEALVNGGPYRLLSVQPIDFFPHTSHVEVFTVLELRGDAPSHTSPAQHPQEKMEAISTGIVSE
jgi:23S rRNA (uracil1939-C5)-methyltransferase